MPQNKPIYGLTAEFIEFLHDEGIAFFFKDAEPVGARECIDRNLLASAPLQPFQSAFGSDAYPTIYDKAACLFFSIAGGHIFTNGNKRTGILALDHFLTVNGIYLFIENDEMVEITRYTASHRQRKEDPAALKQRLSRKFSAKSLPFRKFRVKDPAFYRILHATKRDFINNGFAVESSRLVDPAGSN